MLRALEEGWKGSGFKFKKITDTHIIEFLTFQPDKYGGGCYIEIGIHLDFLVDLNNELLPIEKMDCTWLDIRKRLTPNNEIDFNWTYGYTDEQNQQLINNILNKIPILRTIYSAIGQMTETFTSTDKERKNVVLVEYPRKGTWAVGFATKDNKGEIKKKTNRDLVNVFVPTTPNPTSGFLLMFPKEDVIYLNISFEEASKFIVSAGTSNPKTK